MAAISRVTRDGATLNELFDALGRDATLIAETVAREALIDRRFDDGVLREVAYSELRPAGGLGSFSVPPVDAASCTVDTWIPTSGTPPAGRYAGTAIWTGAEMIVWGGTIWSADVNTGGRYNPATDSWAPTSNGAHVPDAREFHSAVWTGEEMIVWGGEGPNGQLSSGGGRYNPVTDTWKETASLAVPDAREGHVAVWTGREMIVWGGGGLSQGVFGKLSTGGRYDPVTDSWIPTSTADNVPHGRTVSSAVWTGSEMIVWGGQGAIPPDGGTAMLQDGGRYDPRTDSWAPTSIGPEVPIARKLHEAVWTGREMVVWGGCDDNFNNVYNTGGRYDPSADTWTPTSTGPNLPAARINFTALWTGTEMIVWGGSNFGWFNSGGRYDPRLDAWTPTSTAANDPSARESQYAAWTGSRMIIWGGTRNAAFLTSGASYCVGGCAAPSVYYQDRDGDGFGDSSVSVPACQAMQGYVDNNLDCSDADPIVHPGATEVCNGLDDNCDGIVDNGGTALCDDANICTDDRCNGASGCSHANNTAPCDDGNPCTADDACGGGACHAGTLVPAPPEVQNMSVGADKASYSWLAASGATQYDVVRGSTATLPVGSNGADEACFDNLTDTSLVDSAVPSPSTGFWYVSRGENSCGVGTFGTRHDGTPRVTTTCP